MSTFRCLPSACCVVALLAASPVLAETCKPDESWLHDHTGADANTVTTDIKGNRGTRIEICRDNEKSGAPLKVTVQFEHQREPMNLAEGSCLDRFSKWALLRSKGPRNADGSPAQAKGVYRLCRD